MLIKSIRLHNIRSYENAEIDFPTGSVLLAGDIGSGKSTILLAIEFAIFGAKKGELPAYTLLRHGKQEGSVELRMNVDGRDILIKRALKRSKDDIKQESGYVVIGGVKKEGTSEELRAITLEILGYPKDLIKKGKDLIYRYTVYTPQEEMKQILYESEETRLETLRKVFNIDKYRRIRDNSRIITSSLREKKKHLEGFIIDLEYKKKELENKRNEIRDTDRMIFGVIPKIEEIKIIIDGKKKSIQGIENEIKELNALKKELAVTESNLKLSIEQNNRLNEELRRLGEQISAIQAEVEGRDIGKISEISKKIDEKEKEIDDSEASYKNAVRKISELEAGIKQCNDTMEKIRNIEVCPMCEQKVDEDHKHVIGSREEKKRQKIIEEIVDHREEESNLEKLRMEMKKELNALVKEQNHLNILKVRVESLNDKTASRDEKSRLKEEIKKRIGVLNAGKLELASRIGKYAEAEEKYRVARKEIDVLLSQEKFLEVEKGKYEAKKESAIRSLAGIQKEIDEKQKAKEKLAYFSQLGNWIDEFFGALMSTMEKHVMASIHLQFNALFKEWFDALMEDEAISIKVDEEFTPVIEQNGYETYIENLSGGEKTSVALSYRLALNKVINDIVSGIKTKDIIMLDEPTDGFSSEQLDKVRGVIDQLNMKQVILVSHESKIESFVENVIRVQKQEHVSTVV